MADKEEKRAAASEARLQAASDKLEALLPDLADLLVDLCEGRRYVAIETNPKPGDRGWITTIHICDNPDAAAPAEPI